jgi:predicted nucleic acid-binding protein
MIFYMADVLLDSCVWVSLLNHDDSKHEDALELFDLLKRKDLRFIVPEVVVHEVCNVFLRIKKRSYVRDFIDLLREWDSMYFLEESIDVSSLTMDTCLESDIPYSLSYTDLYLHHISAYLSVALYTFDKALLSYIKSN